MVGKICPLIKIGQFLKISDIYNKSASIGRVMCQLTDCSERFFRKTLQCGSSVVNVINGRVPAHLVVLAYLLLDARTSLLYMCIQLFTQRENEVPKQGGERQDTLYYYMATFLMDRKTEFNITNVVVYLLFFSNIEFQDTPKRKFKSNYLIVIGA